MSRFWSQFVQDLDPYVPGEQPRIRGLVKLNTNELPLGPAPSVLAAIRQEATSALRLYPDPQSSDLRNAIAAYHDVDADQVFVGNGSDEVLAHTFAGLLKHDAPILFPDITYSFYPVYCRLYGIQYEAVPLDKGLRICVDEYRPGNGGIIFPNPNAPTGIAISLAEITRLLARHPDVPIVIDEAYVDFGGETAIPLITDHPNLLVVRTMSKSRGLAGLRIGYAIGDRVLVEALVRVKDSFNSYPLDRLAQAGAIASLQDESYFQLCRKQIMQARDLMVGGLEALGFEVLPSAANFVLARHPRHDGVTLAARLRDAAVLVRHFNLPRISNHLRITVGNEEEIRLLLDSLQRITLQSD